MTPLDVQLEALLFWKGEPMRRKKILEALDCSGAELETAISALEKKLEGRGVTLQSKDDEITLGTAKEMSAIIEKLTREELSRDLGKAGLETLAIILYKGPISRRDIDYIRGVNSTFIIRNLLVRGLVEKVQSKTDERVFLYKTTFDLLSFLGLKSEHDLPEFEAVKGEIQAFEQVKEEGVKAEEQQQ